MSTKQMQKDELDRHIMGGHRGHSYCRECGVDVNDKSGWCGEGQCDHDDAIAEREAKEDDQ